MRTTTMEYPKGPKVMKRISEGYLLAWEMMRHNLMEEEIGKSL
jgi:hypothetical protein